MHYNSSWKDLIGLQPLLGKLESLFKIIILTGQVPFVPRLIISALCLKLWRYFHFYAKFYQVLFERKAHPCFRKSKCLNFSSCLFTKLLKRNLTALAFIFFGPSIEPAIFTGERKWYLVTTVYLFQGNFGMPQLKPYILTVLVNKAIFWDQISLGPLHWDITIEWIMYNRFKLISPPSQITKGLPRLC